ncbi:VCBS repeat-containing protein [Streptomyces triticagri]|uniref:VCBS repeat-containing protein n=2 Tax=Streptomyces triticagri TaxID=2293568 RepID=A0A372LWT6_9ACTN|nr:VCBS repeat-containing protein [Streptomyces triticagri]
MASAIAVTGCAVLIAGCSGGQGAAKRPDPSRRPVPAAGKAAVPKTPVPRGRGSRVADDFNGDGHRDLVLDDLAHRGHDDDAGIGIVYGTAHGLDAGARQLLDPRRRAAPVKGVTPAAFDAAATCDLDGDGYTDLVVSTDPPYDGIGQPPVPLQILFGSPDGIRGKAVRLRIPGAARDGNDWPDQPVCGDYDGDGRADLAVHAGNTQLGFLRGPFTRTGAPRSGKLVKAPGTRLRGPAVDADRDGHDDLVVQAGADGKSGLVLGSPAGPAGTGVVFPAGQELVLGRFGKGPGSDAAISTRKAGLALRYEVPGTARATLPADGAALDTGDFDGDGLDDLVVTGARPVVHAGTPGGLAAKGNPVELPARGRTPQVIAAADFDGDDHDDLVVRTDLGRAGDSVTVFTGTPKGLTAHPTTTFTTAMFGT